MAKLTVSTFDTAAGSRWSGDTAYLQIYYYGSIPEAFSFSTGEVWWPSPQNFYREIECTLANNVVTVPTFVLDTTPDITNRSDIFARLVIVDRQRSANSAIVLGERWDVPLTLTEPTTIEALRVHNSPGVRRFDDRVSLSRRDIEALIVAANTAGNAATVAALGRVLMSIAPADAANPVAVGSNDYATTSRAALTRLSIAPASASIPIAAGDNDPRIPTQGENDALVGTSGTPSSSNKYVTNSDARIGSGMTRVWTLATGGLGTLASPFTGWAAPLNAAWAEGGTYDFGGYYYTASEQLLVQNKDDVKIYGNGATITSQSSSAILRIEQSSGVFHDRPHEIIVRDLHLIGNGTTTTHGVITIAMANSYFSKIWVSNVTTTAFYHQFAIGNLFVDCKVSNNSDHAVYSTFPQYGILLDIRSGPEPSQANTFIKCNVEGTTIHPIHISAGHSNTFWGGVVELNQGPIYTTFESSHNRFIGMNAECPNFVFPPGACSGPNTDVVRLYGVANEWDGFATDTVNVGGPDGAATNIIIGGRLTNLTLAATASTPIIRAGTRINGTFTDGTGGQYIAGDRDPVYRQIGGGTFWRRPDTVTGIVYQSLAGNSNSSLGVAPNGTGGGFVQVFANDAVAAPADNAGIGIAANLASDTRIMTFAGGASSRQGIVLAADEATFNSGTADQLKLHTTGEVSVGGGTGFKSLRHGTSTLVAGTVTVTDTAITANSRIFVNRFTDGGTVGASYSVTRSAGASFTLTSKDGSGATQTLDTSVVVYWIVEP